MFYNVTRLFSTKPIASKIIQNTGRGKEEDRGVEQDDFPQNPDPIQSKKRGEWARK